MVITTPTFALFLFVALAAVPEAAATGNAVTSGDDPDPNCARGILEGFTCCAKLCGSCGGPNCGASGHSSECCTGEIAKENRSCGEFAPPCMVPEEPAPPTACGDYPAPLSKTQPNVLLIGDSISMSVPYTPGGYGVPVREMLANHSISSWHNGGLGRGGQASNTVKGLLCTNSSVDGNWLNFSGTYDIIHFNFGLHDLVDPGPGEGKEHVAISQYGENLAEIYRRLAPRAKQIVWTSTTPCPNVTTSMGRTDAKVREYNAEALKALTAAAAAAGNRLVVDDLYLAVDSYCGMNYKTCDLQRPANVHFEPKGCVFMAEHVTKTVLAVLH